LEAFATRTGAVVISGYTVMGGLQGVGQVFVNIREEREAATPAQAQYGISVEIKDEGPTPGTVTAYVDEDELDGLIQGVDYISRLPKSVTSMRNFQAVYRTRAEFAVGTFSSALGEPGFVVQTGRPVIARAFFKQKDLEPFKALLTQAKQQLAQARAGAR